MHRRPTKARTAAWGGAAVALTLAASALGGPVMASIESAGGDLGAVEPAGTDMPTVGGNLGNQNYSALTQINKRT